MFLITALIAVIGGHWAVLQTVAWTTMLAGNLRTVPFAVAVQRTFGGNHPCCLCNEIAAGKRSEKKAQFPSQLKRLEFVSDLAVFVFTAPSDFWLLNESAPRLVSWTHPPPVPPPRSLPG